MSRAVQRFQAAIHHDDAATPPPVDPPALGRFPGDPGASNYYFGGREDQITWPSSETAIANWESRMTPWSGGVHLGIIRVFSAGNIANGFDHVSLCNTHYSNGRLPHISFKLPSGVSSSDASNGSGQFNAWMDGLADAFKSFAPKPIWWTFWHEPENDSIWQGATNEAMYRQACRNMKNALKTRGVTNDTFWTTGYMCPYTFGDRGGSRDWRVWYPDWKGTTAAGSSKDNPNPVDFYTAGNPQSIVDGIGLDIYSWWKEGDPTTGALAYESFDKLFSWAGDRMGFLQKPYSIMEHGVRALHTGKASDGTAVYDTPRTLDYLSQMYSTMSANNIVAMQVYNYALTDQSLLLEVDDPQRLRYQGYGLGIKAGTHARRPGDLGWL